MPGGAGSTRMLPLRCLTRRHAGWGGVDKDVASQTPNNKTCRVGWGRQGCCLSNTEQQDMPGGVGSTRMLPLKHLTTRHAGRGGVDKDVASQTPNNKTCRVGWGRQGCCLSNTEEQARTYRKAHVMQVQLNTVSAQCCRSALLL